MSFVTWAQLEELKQQQKLDRQKEHEKRRKLESDISAQPADGEAGKVSVRDG